MAEHTIKIEGTTPTSSGTMPVNVVTIPANPYTYGIWEVPGVVAANTSSPCSIQWVTVGQAVTAAAPAITSAAAGASPIVTTPPGGDMFILHPGEGVVSRTAVGTVAELWNVSMVWTES